MGKVILVVVVIIIVAVAAYLLGNLYPIGGTPMSPATATPRPYATGQPTTAPATATLPPPGTALPPGTPRPTSIPGMTPYATPSPVPSGSTPKPASTQGPFVTFEIAITDVAGSGLSRTATTELTNTGNMDAHNVWAKVEVFVGGNRIKVSGQDSLRQDIGTLKAGETVTRQVTLSFGLLDGANIMRNGARILLSIYSDEKTETLTYDYAP